ncbi:glyoxalase [Paraburkholderia sp. Ac-20336]|uniref:VOC family protein n=1 Tax=unclassified Paraburkholderia TaxID=2615204 RepID=UPI001980B1AA|nr:MULTISPECIES: VOC family protein [unclassified Paraburkholderia]MBN3806741.1 glyoxalase [Paraburkholderia sp. Ac-20336]MBN3846312.1 glyoxalase [Paraburkholderia sp. Ac-20342]
MNRQHVTLDQINIVSGDVEASIAFYRRLGVDIPEQRVWRTASGAHHVGVGEDGNAAIDFDLDSVGFARIWNSGWQGRQDLRGKVVVGFKLPSRDAVDTTYADLTSAGYTGLQAPYDAFWGARYAVVEDPDGVAVGLMSPPVAELRSAPPEV